MCSWEVSNTDKAFCNTVRRVEDLAAHNKAVYTAIVSKNAAITPSLCLLLQENMKSTKNIQNSSTLCPADGAMTQHRLLQKLVTTQSKTVLVWIHCRTITDVSFWGGSDGHYKLFPPFFLQSEFSQSVSRPGSWHLFGVRPRISVVTDVWEQRRWSYLLQIFQRTRCA